MLTVSELTGLLRASIEDQFPDIWIEGEISNLRAPGSGHLYCTLKDEQSQIRAVLFRSSAGRLRFALQEGMQVIVRGRLTIYEPRGEYQIVLEYVEPKGIGALQLAFEQLKERLAAEGLFDEARKRPLPAFPRTVGVVTSLRGAAIRDILAVLRRRWPPIRILIAPVLVQGGDAARQIAEALAALNDVGHVEIIIVGRGGGSMEDLWSFNEEVVVRAIAASTVPVVSAVGHEIDFTLADFAADFRAPTPSAAAEAVTPVLADIVERLRELTIRIRQAAVRHGQIERRRLEASVQGLASIRFLLQEEAQRADGLADQLHEHTRGLLSTGHDRLRDLQQNLSRFNPLVTIREGVTMVPQLGKRLERQMNALLDRQRRDVQAAVAQLHNLSPLGILGRGYCILSTVPGGHLVRRAGEVQVGQKLRAQLGQGQLSCTVTGVHPDSSV